MVKLKKSSKVEIIGNIPFYLKNEPRPLLGTITHVSGYLVLVRPRYKRWDGEFLKNEVRLIEK